MSPLFVADKLLPTRQVSDNFTQSALRVPGIPKAKEGKPVVLLGQQQGSSQSKKTSVLLMSGPKFECIGGIAL